MAGRASRTALIAQKGTRIAVIVARYHEPISKKLLDGALEALRAHGIEDDRVAVIWVPGSFELPQAAMVLAKSRRFHALVCLGVVIRGETPHFEHVARVAADGIAHVGLTTGIPTAFGVITAESEEQAWARAGGSVGNRGADAALAALEMAGLIGRSVRRSR
jgi:6,7-dimethyl-8-ribityllumazine synthase